MTTEEKNELKDLLIGVIGAVPTFDSTQLLLAAESVERWIDHKIEIAVMQAVQPFLKITTENVNKKRRS